MAEENRAAAPVSEGASPMPEPTFPNVGEPDDAGDGGAGGELTLEQRLEQIQQAQEEERKQFAEERKQWNERFDRLLQGQAAPVTQHAAPPPPAAPEPPVGLDLTGLPDPVDKPQEYHAALQQRMNAALQKQAQALSQSWERQTQQMTSQQSQEQQLNRLWERFQKEYSDLADKEHTLTGAVQAEINDLRARGIDPNRAIFSDQDGFMKNVAGRMRKELGIQPSSPDNASQQLQPPPNRTAGLGTGTQATGTGSKGEGKYPGFVSQLKKAQADSGLI